jgi:uncharacterized membrane protein
LKVWSTQLTLLDLGWGVVVSTVAACAGYRAATLLPVKPAVNAP